MAQVLIYISDSQDGGSDVVVECVPPLPSPGEQGTPAQRVAQVLLDQMVEGMKGKVRERPDG